MMLLVYINYICMQNSRHEKSGSKTSCNTELIQRAKEAGFDFGKGDPVNRLRYYTKLGSIPHAQRKQAQAGQAFTVGHYPISTLDQLLKIQGIRRKDIGGDLVQAGEYLQASKIQQIGFTSTL